MSKTRAYKLCQIRQFQPTGLSLEDNRLLREGVEGAFSSLLADSLAILACEAVFFLPINFMGLMVGSEFGGPLLQLYRAILYFGGEPLNWTIAFWHV